MAKYLVVHPKLNMKVSINDGESKFQRVPVGSTVEVSDKAAKKLLEQRKIKTADSSSIKVTKAK